jgi:hypothetical protein
LVEVLGASSSTHAQGVELVAVAVAITCRDVGAPTFVDLSGPVADAAGVVLPDTIVVDVADAISVRIGHAVAATHAKGVKLVAATIAIASRDVHTTALVDLARTVANAAGVQRANALVHIVADAVLIEVLGASSSTHA